MVVEVSGLRVRQGCEAWLNEMLEVACCRIGAFAHMFNNSETGNKAAPFLKGLRRPVSWLVVITCPELARVKALAQLVPPVLGSE